MHREAVRLNPKNPKYKTSLDEALARQAKRGPNVAQGRGEKQ